MSPSEATERADGAPLASERVERLLPALTKIAELMRDGTRSLEAADLMTLARAGDPGQSHEESVQGVAELQHWAALLREGLDGAHPNVIVAALELRGVPVANGRLAVSRLFPHDDPWQDRATDFEPIECAPRRLFLQELAPNEPIRLTLQVSGGPATVSTESGAVRTNHDYAGPGKTALEVEADAQPDGTALFDRITLENPRERIVIDVALRWKARSTASAPTTAPTKTAPAQRPARPKQGAKKTVPLKSRPTPPPSPPRRWPWLIVGLALIVGIATWRDLSGNDEAAAARFLRDRVPAHLTRCNELADPAGRLASIRCRRYAMTVYYSLYASQTELSQAFMRARNHARARSTCGSRWTLGAKRRTQGALFCYLTPSGRARMLWSQRSTRILARAGRPDGRQPALRRSWVHLGPDSCIGRCAFPH
jgi:hypothetical protein